MPTNAERARFVWGEDGYIAGFEYRFDTGAEVMWAAIAALLAKGWFIDIEGAPQRGYTVSLTSPSGHDSKPGHDALNLSAAFVAALDAAMEKTP